MIKKLIGIFFSAAVIATIVFTVLGCGRYRSIIGQVDFAWPSFSRSEPVSAAVPGPEESRSEQSAPVTAPSPSAADDEDAAPDYMENADEELPSDLFANDDY